MAHLWLNFHQMHKEQKYYNAAKEAILFVARTQNIVANNSNIRGAILVLIRFLAVTSASSTRIGQQSFLLMPCWRWTSRMGITTYLILLDKSADREKNLNLLVNNAPI